MLLSDAITNPVQAMPPHLSTIGDILMGDPIEGLCVVSRWDATVFSRAGLSPIDLLFFK